MTENQVIDLVQYVDLKIGVSRDSWFMCHDSIFSRYGNTLLRFVDSSFSIKNCPLDGSHYPNAKRKGQ